MNLTINCRWVHSSALPLPDGTTMPFSVAILGDKVGWVPPEVDRVNLATVLVSQKVFIKSFCKSQCPHKKV